MVKNLFNVAYNKCTYLTKNTIKSDSADLFSIPFSTQEFGVALNYALSRVGNCVGGATPPNCVLIRIYPTYQRRPEVRR